MAVALAGGACSAAIPSVDELEISGAIRFSVPRGVIVSSGASGLPVLVTQRGKLCTGDLPDRVATGEDIDIVDAVPVAELSLDLRGLCGSGVLAGLVAGLHTDCVHGRLLRLRV